MREIYDRQTGQFLPADEFYARKAEGVAVSHLPAPMLITDNIELQSQVDGKTYTSKARLRRSYRERGYVEVGNEWLGKDFKKPEPKVDRKAIRDSVRKAAARVGI